MISKDAVVRATQAIIRNRFFSSAATNEGGEIARVLVVGSGRMGQIRADLVRASSRLELCGIVDIDIEAAQKTAAKHQVASFRSLKEAFTQRITNQTIQGVILCTPTLTHGNIIKEACDYGVHIFTEKPVDETADQIAHLFDYANKSSIQLCCGFQRRFDPSYVAASRAIQNGSVGRPIMAHMFFADHPVPPREFLLTGGNIYMDLSAHDIDFIMHALQDKVVSVFATGSSSDEELAAANVQDNATLLMNFSHGTVVTLFMSRAATYGYDQRCEIFGTKGLVSVNNIREHTTLLSNVAGTHQARLQHSFPQRFFQAFGLELDAFADAILNNTTWPVTAAQCINVQRVADAAYESSRKGQMVSVASF